MKEINKKEYLIYQIKKVLIRENGNNEFNHNLFDLIKKAKIDEIKTIVEDSKLPPRTIKHIFEIIRGVTL